MTLDGAQLEAAKLLARLYAHSAVRYPRDLPLISLEDLGKHIAAAMHLGNYAAAHLGIKELAKRDADTPVEVKAP